MPCITARVYSDQKLWNYDILIGGHSLVITTVYHVSFTFPKTTYLITWLVNVKGNVISHAHIFYENLDKTKHVTVGLNTTLWVKVSG